MMLVKALVVTAIACGSAACSAQSVSEQYLLLAANQVRASAGLRPVRVDPALHRAASEHAETMAAHQDISHQFSGERDLAQRAGDTGAQFSLITENVAEASNAALIHDMWMNSPGHRANLLDPQVDSVGLAVVARRGQLYAVEDFARSVQHLEQGEQEIQVEDLIANRGLILSPATADARRTCAMKSGYAGAREPLFVIRYTTSSLNRLPDQLTERLASGKYREAAVGACVVHPATPFSSYSLAVLLYP